MPSVFQDRVVGYSLPTINHEWGELANQRGAYSATVKADWRVTFRFHEGAVFDVNLEDYH